MNPHVSEADFAAEYTAAMARVRALSGGASAHEDALIDAATDALLDARARYDPARASWPTWARLCVYRRLSGASAPGAAETSAGDMGGVVAPAAPGLDALSVPSGTLAARLVERVVVWGDTVADAARACGVDGATARAELKRVARRVLRGNV